MKLLKRAGTYTILTKPKDIIHDIASAARTCYQSFKDRPRSADITLVKSLIEKGHHAMLEMADLKIRFSKVSRGFTHEIVRHRLCSFAQECVVGETKISSGTIEELYSYKINNKLFDLSEKNITIKSVNEHGNIINNKVLDVIKNKQRKVFEVKTELGCNLLCTEEHEIFININKSKKLKEINVGDSIIINNVFKYKGIEKEEFKKLYITYRAKEVSCMLLREKDLFLSKNVVKDRIVSIVEVGIRDVFDLVMQQPYNNYIANGIMVHNSTRYVDEKGFDLVIPPHKEGVVIDAIKKHGKSVDDFYSYLRNIEKWKPEDARQILPIGMSNEIVVKANIREWRHIFKMRCDKFAHWEIRGLMLELLKWCKKNIPLVFDDFYFFYDEKKGDYARPVLSKSSMFDVIVHALGNSISKEELLEFIKKGV